MSLPLDLTPDMPEGFSYRPDFITPDEETDLLARIGALPFVPFQFQGFEARRRVVYFGWRYDFNDNSIGRADEIPAFLLPLRERVATFAGVEPAAFEHVLINAYDPGAPLGWHRDRPQFGDVAGVSLGAPVRFRMRLRQPRGFLRKAMILEPRSAYLLRGPARTQWEHSLPPAEALRYSITFRTLRAARENGRRRLSSEAAPH